MNATGRQDSFNHLARKGFRPVTGNQATLDNDDIEAQKPGLAVEKSWRFTREMATADDKTLGHIAHQELKVRMGFLRKVVFLVLIQLSVTGGACVLAATVPAVAQFIQDTPALFYVCCGMVFVMIIVFLCIDGFRRRFPMNYICLFSFTVFESYLLAGVTAFLDSQLVIIALIMILSTVTMILTYAFQVCSYFSLDLLFVAQCPYLSSRNSTTPPWVASCLHLLAFSQLLESLTC